jgi:hypothetical protein
LKIKSSSGVELDITGEELRTSISLNTKTDSMLDVYHLNMLVDILVVGSIESDEKRQGIIRSKSVTSHMAAGAIIGGGIDALSSGDSILDGILVGAVLGYLFAPSKKDPLARVTLVFADGFSFAVSLDRDALNHLVAVGSINRSSDASVSKNQPSHGCRKLKSSEKYWCHKQFHNMKLFGMCVIVLLLSTIVAFIFSEPTTTSQDGIIHLFSSLETLIRDVGKAWVVAAIISLALAILMNYLYKNPYSSVDSDEA